MRPHTFAATSFEQYRKTTRREVFLAAMDKGVPWAELCSLIEPVYPKAAGAGRPPIGVERIRRIYFVPRWFILSDAAVEDELYDSRAIRGFVGVALGREPVPDATPVCKFRHRRRETHARGTRLFSKVGEYLQTRGLKIITGTRVDAMIIAAPCARPRTRARSAIPRGTRPGKGNRWHVGMKAHLGAANKTQPSGGGGGGGGGHRPTSMTARRWGACCRVMRRGCGAMRPTPVKAR